MNEAGRDRRDIDRHVIARVQEFLGLPDVSLSDDFLELGGDSLSAILVAASLEIDLGAPVDVSIIFETGSLEELCVRLRNELGNG